MKFPESKLNIDDTLYELDGRNVVQWSVIGIKCIIGHDFQPKIIYGIKKVTGYENAIYESQVGKDYFTSKKELLIHTFGDCLTEGLIVK